MNYKKIIMGIISIVSFVFFAYIAISIMKSRFPIDYQVNSLIPSIQTAAFTPIALAIGYIFDTIPVTIVALIIAVFLWFLVSRKDAVFLAVIMIINGILIEGFKFLTHAVRPTNMIANETSYSFPSGHATTIVVFFGTLLYLYWPKKISWRIIFTIICVVVMDFIGFDRLYLNVHWFTDVIGGQLLAIGLLSLLMILKDPVLSLKILDFLWSDKLPGKKIEKSSKNI